MIHCAKECVCMVHCAKEYCVCGSVCKGVLCVWFTVQRSNVCVVHCAKEYCVWFTEQRSTVYGSLRKGVSVCGSLCN